MSDGTVMDHVNISIVLAPLIVSTLSNLVVACAAILAMYWMSRR